MSSTYHWIKFWKHLALHSETDAEYIQKVLVPLEYPFIVPHYDKMYARLSGLYNSLSCLDSH